jgi:hypothetical protein
MGTRVAQVEHAGASGPGAPPSRWRRDRRFFSGMAVAAALTVFIGFAPTYYLNGLSGARPLSPLVHVHATVFTGWILLFVAQTSLIAAGRADVHRRLGVAGVVLGVVMLMVGYQVAVEAARLGHTPPGWRPLEFLSVPLGGLVSFGVLAGAGLHQRRRSETHKRLMLLATIALLIPAIARMRFIAGGGPPAGMAGTTLFVVACMLYDRLAHGRVHPAFLWGGLFLLLTMPLRVATGRTEAWLVLARWLTGQSPG